MRKLIFGAAVLLSVALMDGCVTEKVFIENAAERFERCYGHDAEMWKTWFGRNGHGDDSTTAICNAVIVNADCDNIEAIRIACWDLL